MEDKSKRIGRPPKDPARHKRNRTLSFTDDEYNKLLRIAEAANRGVSELIIEQFGLNQPDKDPTP